MSNTNLIYSIKECWSDFLEGKQFEIPEYQRAYKWSEEEVKTLMDDIHQFSQNKKDDNQFYCLQNITLVPEQNYHVVDGQQRLTTLYILLAYLKEQDLIKDKLKYSIRERSHKFLVDEIESRKIWDSLNLQKECSYVDMYYMTQAAITIKNWFEDNEEYKEKFKETLLNDVKFIINTVFDATEEDLFTNLNSEKMDLDGADLVRAILMTRVAKEIEGKKGEQNTHTDIRVNEHRVKIGIELDEMGHWWNQGDVKTFFEFFVPTTFKPDKFKSANQSINVLYQLYFLSKNDTESKNLSLDIRFFEKRTEGETYLAMYNEIRQLHFTLKEWFDDRTIYHLLGFYMNFPNSRRDFKSSYQTWNDCQSKSDFTKHLKTEIREKFASEFRQEEKPEDKNQSAEELIELYYQQVKNIEFDWYNESLLQPSLVLCDVIRICKNDKLIKLPVTFFKPNKEDKEHILPQTPERKEGENKTVGEWTDYFNTLDFNVQLPKSVVMKDTNERVDTNLEQEIYQVLNRVGLNSIGNLVLLNGGVNKSYKNTSYPKKKHRIAQEIARATYIRPHTFDVFFKTNEKSPTDAWNACDIKKSAEYLATTIKNFLNS